MNEQTNTDKRTLRANLNWRRMVVGQSVSQLGDAAFDITVLLWVATIICKGQSWAPAATSGILLAVAIPVVVFSPLAGVYVDRHNRRTVMLAADALRMALVCGLAFLPLAGTGIPRSLTLAVVYLVVATQSAIGQLFVAARLGVLRVVVESSGMVTASGVLQVILALASILGPSLASLTFGHGVEWALLIDGATFAVSFGMTRSIRAASAAFMPDIAKASKASADLRDGLRFFAGNAVLKALVFSVSIAAAGSGVFTALQVFFVKDNLHASGSWIGIILAGYGAGAICAGFAARRISNLLGPQRTMWIALLIQGVLLLCFSQAIYVWQAVIVMTLVGIALGASNAMIVPILLEYAPENMIGRVMGVFNPAVKLSNIMSAALAGLLATVLSGRLHVEFGFLRFNSIDTILTTGALVIFAAGIIAERMFSRVDMKKRCKRGISGDRSKESHLSDFS